MARNGEIYFSFDGHDFNMTEQQKLFCMEYVRLNFNGKAAALAAGYAEKTAVSIGSGLIQKPHTKKFIDYLKGNIAAQIGISAADIAREYAKIGFSDVRQVFDENGNLLQVQNFEDKAAANVSSIEVFEERDREGNFVGNTKKVRFYDKVNALDKLAKMIGCDEKKKDEGEQEKDNTFVLKIVRS